MVSVIVPVYNSEQYLKECIESVLSQDYHDWKLILVDDGSKDNSSDICNSYKDNRIFYIKKENGGVSSSRNVGMQIAENFGGYFTFLDSDDTLPVDALSTLLSAIEESDADCCVGAYSFLYGAKLLSHSCRLKAGTYNTESLLPFFIDDGTLSGFLIGSVWGVLYKTEIAFKNTISFDTNIKFNEDGLFNFEYALHTKNISFTSKCVYHYRQYGNSSRSKRKVHENYNEPICKRLESLDWDKQKNCFDDQMSARNVSLALWDIMLFTQSMSFFQAYKAINERLKSEDVRQGLNFINYKDLTLYKKLCAYLICYKFSFVLCFTFSILVPFLSRRLRR